MASSAGQSVMRHLRRAAALSDEVAESDAALLQAFISQRDEAAFAVLVRRHGPMVLAVCRRVVGHRDDADDAFQAAFLVLARKAHTLEDRHLLANWLYGVAYRTALEARTRMLRRSATVTTVPDFPDTAAEAGEDNSELLAMLDRELNRLSEKYRVPVVLCELEGRSRREAAELLGIPEGTLSSRLAVARRLLAERLRRRGVAVSVVAVTAALSHRAAAFVPSSLLKSTVAAAATESVAPAVLTLTQGVLKVMFLKKLQLSMVLIAALGLGSGLVTLGVVGGKPAVAQPDDKPKPPPAQPKIAGKGSLLGGWTIVSIAQGGRERPSGENGPQAMFFGKDKGYLMGKDGEGASFTYKLDPSQKPNRVDLELDPAAVQGDTNKLLGIFELRGDSMTLGFHEGRNGARPDSFATKEGSNTVVLVLRRDKDVKEPEPKTAEEKKEKRDRMVSVNNMKQIGLALHNYHDVTGRFPAAAIHSKDGKPLLSWRVAILPYIEQDALYKQFKLDEPWDSMHNKKLLARMPRVYGPKGTDTHYRVFTGKGTIFDGQQGMKFSDIRDGTSNTILVVESGDTVPWTKPDDIAYDPEKPLPKLGGKPFKNGFNAGFADGSVRFIQEKVAEKTLRALITAGGGEVVDPSKNDE